MANYYTRTVITESVLLTDALHSVLLVRGAQAECEGPSETILDALAFGREEILNSYYVTFENGWNNQWDSVDEYIDDELDEGESVSDEFRRLFEMEEHEILLEILKINPMQDHIVEQSSWSCSKMRADGFGGSGLIVNRKGFLYITTSNYQIRDDGEIIHGGTFTPWEECANVPA